jgi:hypothetical protein
MLEQRDTSSPEPGPSRPGRAPLTHFFHSPFACFSLCALTFLAASFFLLGLQGVLLLVSGKVRFWHLLLMMSPTLWVVSLLVMFNEWRNSRTLWAGPRRQRMEALLGLVLTALMFLVPSILPLFTSQSVASAILGHAADLVPLPNFPTKLVILELLRDAVVILLTAGMFGVHRQLSGQLRQSPSPREEPEAERLAEDVRRYQQLRSRLERFLGFSAANIGVLILSTGALRNLLNETAPGPPEIIPAGSVVAFGAYYTWLLAIIYLPIRKTLNDVGQALAEGLVRHSLVTRITWKQWGEEQKAVRTYLGLQGSGLQDLQQGLSVLAPLLASISSLVLGSQG